MDTTLIERFVADALDTLPEEFGNKLQNITIVVEDWPTEEQLRLGNVPPGMTLFGLYQGIPLPKRNHYHAVLPDRITLFAGPLLRAHGKDILQLQQQVRDTVIHEIGHYFGMNEKEIRAAQSKKYE